MPRKAAEDLLARPSMLSVANGENPLARRPSSLIAHPAIEAPPILGSPAHPLPAPDDDMFASYAVIGFPGEED